VRRLIRTTGGIDCEASDALNAGDGAVLTRVVVPGKRQRVRGEAVVEFVWRGGAGENIPRIVFAILDVRDRRRGRIPRHGGLDDLRILPR